MDSPIGQNLHHLVVSTSMSLSQLLQGSLKLNAEETQHLLGLGGIYLNKKRIYADSNLSPEDYVRVHAKPKRYAAHLIHWPGTILFQNSDFVVVDKPSGIPVHATVDNSIENISHQLSLLLSIPLYITHRLDVPVSGLLVLAKTKDFQKLFNQWLLEKKTRKLYQALTTQEPRPGIWIHYMKRSLRAPKELSSTLVEDYLQCELEIFNVRPVGAYFKSDILLKTGRTHQIRAQLSHLHCPILGDSMYGAPEPAPPPFNTNRIGLRASEIDFGEFHFKLPELF